MKRDRIFMCIMKKLMVGMGMLSMMMSYSFIVMAQETVSSGVVQIAPPSVINETSSAVDGCTFSSENLNKAPADPQIAVVAAAVELSASAGEVGNKSLTGSTTGGQVFQGFSKEFATNPSYEKDMQSFFKAEFAKSGGSIENAAQYASNFKGDMAEAAKFFQANPNAANHIAFAGAGNSTFYAGGMVGGNIAGVANSAAYQAAHQAATQELSKSTTPMSASAGAAAFYDAMAKNGYVASKEERDQAINMAANMDKMAQNKPGDYKGGDYKGGGDYNPNPQLPWTGGGQGQYGAPMEPREWTQGMHGAPMQPMQGMMMGPMPAGMNMAYAPMQGMNMAYAPMSPMSGTMMMGPMSVGAVYSSSSPEMNMANMTFTSSLATNIANNETAKAITTATDYNGATDMTDHTSYTEIAAHLAQHVNATQANSHHSGQPTLHSGHGAVH